MRSRSVPEAYRYLCKHLSLVFAAKSDRNLRVTQYNQIWDCNLTGKHKMNSMTGLLTGVGP
ncbi:hypothetical protein [Argonema galeatum]|uniref:hypothetical protein n=1 Tax=Argonema galeatum TaxID=2942762 RepID=UPI002011C7F7|nr:hypothetical protein [Argonema galeatum]MCL1462891.1 hypothetical protein [Argonema galeatum A003/A1]